MITQQFITLWFLFSAAAFLIEAVAYHLYYDHEPERDDNTFLILLAQGLGALGAYIALH